MNLETLESGLLALKNKSRNVEKEKRIKIDTTKTEYPLIRNVAANQIGWRSWGRQDQKDDANLFWVDTYVTEENIKRLKPYQRVNHFPSSQQLGKKNLLSDNLKKMRQLLPNDYDFFPSTWNVPEQLQQLKSAFEEDQKWYIVKPASSSQGKGIYLTRNFNAVCKQPGIVQEYIMNPHVVDNYKFDLRIYVLIKSLFPLKIFRYEEGLTRLGTHEYEHPNKQNKTDLNIHLTNYAINKLNPSYIPNKDIKADNIGHKRSLAAIFNHFQSRGCNKSELLERIDRILVKTILAAYPKMLFSYKNCRDFEAESDSVCFQILGFDILIDANFRPWLLEVNHSPSFYTDSPLDYVIKKHLVLDTLVLLNMKATDKESFLKNKVKDPHSTIKEREVLRNKKTSDALYESEHLGGYSQIYPSSLPDYSRILQRVFEKKMKIKQTRKLSPQTPSTISEKLTSQVLPTFIRPNEVMTMYGNYLGPKSCRHKGDDQEVEKNDSLRRHIFVEKQKRKIIEPIKMKNISISFYEGLRAREGYESRSPNSNRNVDKKEIIKHEIYQSIDSKTADKHRKAVRQIESEIKSRIGKMKLARIKLQKIKENEKKHDLLSERILGFPKGERS